MLDKFEWMAKSHDLKYKLKTKHGTFKNIQTCHKINAINWNKDNLHCSKLIVKINNELLQENILVWVINKWSKTEWHWQTYNFMAIARGKVAVNAHFDPKAYVLIKYNEKTKEAHQRQLFLHCAIEAFKWLCSTEQRAECSALLLIASEATLFADKSGFEGIFIGFKGIEGWLKFWYIALFDEHLQQDLIHQLIDILSLQLSFGS